MDGGVLTGVARFRSDVFPKQMPLYRQLVRDGQQPKALVISCGDSRVIPELIMQCGPGELFVCRNAGNIVPPFMQATGGVSATIEYAVMALDVRDIVVCGHSDCGAMKGLLHPETLGSMPAVTSWLKHSHAAVSVFNEAYAGLGLSDAEAARVMAQENVSAQLQNLRTHPCVAARLATRKLRLHGWFFDLDHGQMHALDGQTGEFQPMDEDETLPVAVPPSGRPGAVLPLSGATFAGIGVVQQAHR